MSVPVGLPELHDAVDADAVAVTPARAVLHRPAAGTGGSDCAEVPVAR